MEQISALTFVDISELSNSQDPIKKLIASLFLTQEIDSAKVLSLLGPFRDFQIETLRDYENGLEILLAAALFADLSESVKEEIQEELLKIFDRFRFHADFEIPQLESLISFFLQNEILEGKSEGERLSFDKQALYTIYEGMRAVFIKGSIERFRDNLSHFLASFDLRFGPFYGLKQEEQSFKRSPYLATFYLLFYIGKKNFVSPQLEMTCDALLKMIHDEPSFDCPALIALLYLYFDLKYEEVRECPPLQVSFPHYSRGTLFCREESYSVALTLRGRKSGLGAIHKEKVKILSFGPQFGQIGDIENFGLFCETAEGEYEFKKIFEGWTKLKAPHSEPPIPSDLWLYQKALFSPRALTLICEKRDEENELLFTFYLKADEVNVDQKILKPLSLDRYAGHARELLFRTGAETIEIKCPAHCQIIPLAGGDHFWSANFLLIYAFKKSVKEISFTII